MKRRKSLRYLVMIRRTATGYSVDVPDVLGCVAVAKTVTGARRLIAEALTLHLELTREGAEPIPVPIERTDFSPEEDGSEEYCTCVEVHVPEPVRSPRKAKASAKMNGGLGRNRRPGQPANKDAKRGRR